jgi:hypothetical protein
MRLIGLILSLGAIMWVLYQASGGGKSESIIPQEHVRSMEKAESVEQSLQEATQLQMKKIDELSQ